MRKRSCPSCIVIFPTRICPYAVFVKLSSFHYAIVGWSVAGLSIITKVIFSVTASQFGKRSFVSFCDSNPVICTWTIFSSSTNHHHWSITFIPVTPEADLLSALDVSTALSLLKPVCWLVLCAILNRTTTQRLIVGPDRAIFKVAYVVILDRNVFPPCGLQQRSVWGRHYAWS